MTTPMSLRRSSWRRSLRSNLEGIDPEKLYRATLKFLLVVDLASDRSIRTELKTAGKKSIFLAVECSQ